MQKKTQHELESGVVVVDKHVNLIGLAASCFILMDKHMKDEFKKVSHGDKEAFWIGFSITETPFSFVHNYQTGAIGEATTRIDNGVTIYSVCTVQIMHPDQFGRPLWINGGLSRNKWKVLDVLKNIEVYLLEPGNWQADKDPNGGGGFCLESKEKPLEFDSEMRKTIDASGKLYLVAYQNDGK
jgi:hypothetical protein